MLDPEEQMQRTQLAAGWWLIFCVALGFALPGFAYAAGSERSAVQAPGGTGGAPSPRIPQPLPLDPTLIYNSVLSSGLVTPTAEVSASGSEDWSISPATTNLANGARLNYPNAPLPQSCLTFDDLGQWASQSGGGIQNSTWNDYYGGWKSFAVDDGGFYLAANVATSLDRSIGNKVAAKVASGQPFAAGFRSPWFAVTPGGEITVRVRYLLEKAPDGRKSFDWVALGIKTGSETPASFANGYVHGRWAEVENRAKATGDRFMVLLQAHNPAVVPSAAYFDDVEVFVEGVALPACAY
jgi:hypothetical protein